MRNYKELKVWEKAHKLTLTIYEVTKNFPSEEKFGITSQIRRAASAVPTNIAEGCGFNSDKQFARFMTIALGSATEVEYLIFLAFELNFLTETEHETLREEIIEIKKMLYTFITKLT
ncbi:MAG: four helix bundle protein [Flavobacteriales bacterium]|jgi:four helix bundle protein